MNLFKKIRQFFKREKRRFVINLHKSTFKTDMYSSGMNKDTEFDFFAWQEKYNDMKDKVDYTDWEYIKEK